MVVRELSDQTFHSVHDVQNALGMPVLATVPAVEIPREMSRRRLWIWGASSAALIALLLVGGTIFWFAMRPEAKKVAQPRPGAAALEIEVGHV